MDPSKFRPISLINIGGKVLEKLLINRTNHHMYKNELLIDNVDLCRRRVQQTQLCRGKKFIEPELENRKVVIMASLDVKGPFDAVWWPSIVKGLKDSECSRNLYYLGQGYFSQRTAVMSTNSVVIQ